MKWLHIIRAKSIGYCKANGMNVVNQNRFANRYTFFDHYQYTMSFKI